MDWTYGYVQEIDYTHGYYRELAPGLLELACLSRGVNSLLSAKRPLKYLELGFGQGLSVNIHAAACEGEYWGTDFNPAHAINARELATAAGSGARLFDGSFEEIARRDDLPEFDVITMHGTWSWISAANRQAVTEFVRRHLAPGGAFYVSYNCWPGWASELPLRHLLKLHADLASPQSQPLPEKIDAAIGFAQSLLDAGARYFRAHGGLKVWLEKMRGHSRNYLAHEYFNQDWHPMPFAEIAAALGEAKLEFAASASLIDHLDGLGSSEAARKMLAEVRHPVLRETVRDYLVNQRFRRDVFVRGLRRMPNAERDERLRHMAFALMAHPEQIALKVSLPYGEADLHADIYRPLIDALAEDRYAPKTLDQLSQHPKCKHINLGQFIQAALLLTGAGNIHPAQSPAVIKRVAPRCKALNAHLLARTMQTEGMSALASPVIGGGVIVARLHQLFVRAIAGGLATEADWAGHAWEAYKAHDQRALKDGKPLESEADNLAFLQEEAKQFAAKRLPILKALGIA